VSIFRSAKQYSVASSSFLAFLAVGVAASAALGPAALAQAGQTLTGQAAFTDWNQQQPGVRHKITVADLPQPYATESSNNQPKVIARPANAWPVAPAGFKVTLYAGGDTAPMQRADNVEHMTRSKGTFTEPRLITVAPNGDLFLADSGAGEVIVLRGVRPDGKAAQIATFATGLDHPFGIAFYPAENPRYVYIANTSNVVRFAYHAGDLHATGAAETVVPQQGWETYAGLGRVGFQCRRRRYQSA
jgi:glucose/arabinose dehydrogenase